MQKNVNKYERDRKGSCKRMYSIHLDFAQLIWRKKWTASNTGQGRGWRATKGHGLRLSGTNLVKNLRECGAELLKLKKHILFISSGFLHFF